ncbi:hypothetical protein U1Q18_011525 [Sarracenia purpurea var. burkii]
MHVMMFGFMVAVAGMGSGGCCWFLAAGGLVLLVLDSFCYCCQVALSRYVQLMSLHLMCSCCQVSYAIGGQVLVLEFGCLWNENFAAERGVLLLWNELLWGVGWNFGFHDAKD